MNKVMTQVKFQNEKSNIINQGYIYQLEMQEQLNKDPKQSLWIYNL